MGAERSLTYSVAAAHIEGIAEEVDILLQKLVLQELEREWKTGRYRNSFWSRGRTFSLTIASKRVPYEAGTLTRVLYTHFVTGLLIYRRRQFSPTPHTTTSSRYVTFHSRSDSTPHSAKIKTDSRSADSTKWETPKLRLPPGDSLKSAASSSSQDQAVLMTESWLRLLRSSITSVYVALQA